MVLALKNLLFTLVVPGTVGVYVPLMLSRRRTAATGLVFTLALVLFTIGGSIYARCVFVSRRLGGARHFRSMFQSISSGAACIAIRETPCMSACLP
jgi:hypothetical protein